MGIDYPDSATDPIYRVSVMNGTDTLIQTIKNYAGRCPDTAIVLLGYSQGAQITLNSLCGSSPAQFGDTPGIDPDTLGKHIESVISMGDPTHVPGRYYDVGTSTRQGIFPRTNLKGCFPFSSRIQSYCDTGDRYCDNATHPTNAHGQYVGEYGKQAEDFVVAKHMAAAS